MQNFVNFDDWTAAAQALDLTGPLRIHGYLSYQYVNARGVQQAVWNGADDTGSVFIDAPSAPAGEVAVAAVDNDSPMLLDENGEPLNDNGETT